MEPMIWWQNGEVVALGWTLLHFCWQGAAIAMLYALADPLTRHASANLRYGIGMVAIALMPLAAVLTFSEQARLLVHIPRDGHEVMASQLGSLHTTIINAVPIAAPAVERSELWIAWNADRLLPWVVGIWLAGVLLLAVRAFGGWWQLEQVRRTATSLVPAEVEASFRRIAAQLKMHRKIALALSEEVISPLAMGVWRTAIILPVSAVMQLSPEQLEAVLAHEMAHVRRWDYLANLLQTTVECLLFFHPAVWWVSRRTRDLRELCCDEVAAKSCTDPTIYVEALLQLETQRAKHLHLAAALHGRGGSLLKRIKQLLGEEITMERETMSGVRIGVVGAVVLALILGPSIAKGLGPAKQLAPVPNNMQATVATATTMTDPGAAPVAATAFQPRTQPAPTEQPQTVATAVAASESPAPTIDPASQAVVAPRVGTLPIYENNNIAARAAYGTAYVSRPPRVPFKLTIASTFQENDKPHQSGEDYLNKMKEAGYTLDLNNDLDTIVALRSQGVTPEYAKAMAQAGLGTPTLRDLISLKASGVTPEYVAALHASGIAPASFHDAISEKSLGITPEYAKAVASMGFEKATLHDVISMKAQGITPDYAAALKAAGITVKDAHELISLKALDVTPEYAKGMSAAGFGNLSPHDLVSMRAQGFTPEQARWLKQTFPTAEMSDLRRATSFHIDADFVAKAKSHGFNDASLDKLVKLKITGLLD